MRYFIEFSYNGKSYHGWQYQPNAISIQEVLNSALSKILKAEISVMGAGRTDAGVHAAQMFGHFDCDVNFDKDVILFRLNSYLPPSIAIFDIFEVDPKAHSRFHALSRTYRYRIATTKNVFIRDFAYSMHKPLDIDKMNAASLILFEYIDFQCFSRSNTDVKTFNCDIKEAFWTYTDGELVFTITANRFLRNMVRAIVGTLINVGLGKIEVEAMHEIIQSKDRSKAGFSAPANGLTLMHIEYPESIKEVKTIHE